MGFKVAITTQRPVPEGTTHTLKQAGLEVIQASCRTEDEVIRAAAEADGMMVAIWPLTSRRILEALPNLKVVSRQGVGTDSVDVEAATELGICVCNTPGVNTSEVADHAMSLLLSLTRRITTLAPAVRDGAWSDRPSELEAERGRLLRIAGGVAGIIGFGNIGRAFASRIRGFGPAEIIACDPYVPQTTADLYGVRLVDLDTLLERSDFISIHTPLTAETHHMMDAARFKKMKPSSILINTARGPVVSEAGLHEALSRGYIAGAGIDVTEVEPLDAESPLLKLENLIITPHFAGASPVSARESARKWPENVIRVLSGQPPHGLVNPEVMMRIAVMRSKGSSRWDGVPQS